MVAVVAAVTAAEIALLEEGTTSLRLLQVGEVAVMAILGGTKPIFRSAC